MRHLIAAAALLTIAGASAPAFAFPPTATVSPGYDRALAESRRARTAEPAIVAPRVDEPRKPRRPHRHELPRYR